MVPDGPNRLLVLRRLQRRDVGIRRLHPRHRALLQGCTRNCGRRLLDYQRGHQLERRDGGVVSCAISRAGEGRVGILGELWYVVEYLSCRDRLI